MQSLHELPPVEGGQSADVGQPRFGARGKRRLQPVHPHRELATAGQMDAKPCCVVHGIPHREACLGGDSRAIAFVQMGEALVDSAQLHLGDGHEIQRPCLRSRRPRARGDLMGPDGERQPLLWILIEGREARKTYVGD